MPAFVCWNATANSNASLIRRVLVISKQNHLARTLCMKQCANIFYSSKAIIYKGLSTALGQELTICGIV